MKKLNPSLVLLTLSLSLMGQNSVSATIINSTFSGTADFGPLEGENYNGTATFDDSTITESGNESVPTDDFELTFNEETFNNSTADTEGSATAIYVDGLFAGIQYSSLPITDLSVALIAGSFDTEDASFAYDLSGRQGSGPITYTQNGVLNPVSTPEPSFILGLFGVCAMGILRKRRKHS